MLSEERKAEQQMIWNEVLDAKGTAYVFGRRAAKLRKRLNVNNYVGLALPVLVGGIVLNFGKDATWLTFVLPLTGILAVVQFLLTLASFVWGWQSDLEYSVQSSTKNNAHAEDLEQLAKNISRSDEEFLQKREVLRRTGKILSEADHQKGVTEKERRMGMRWSLREMQRPCAVCNVVPTSMTPDQCGVCGSF